MSGLPEYMRKPFEHSVGATLALDLTRENGYYTSPKTSNLWIAFCYGWMRGEGTTKSFMSLLEEIIHGPDPQH